MKVLKDLISTEEEDVMDHKNLNGEVAEFKTLNLTAENIAVVIWNRLRPNFLESQTLEVQLFETPRNFVANTGN